MAYYEYEKELMKALSQCKPSDVIKNKALLQCFHQFIKKGTVLEWCEILPESFKARNVFTAIQQLREPVRDADVATQQPQQPRDTPKPPNEQYFEKFVSEEQRLKKLYRIAQRMTAVETTTQICKDREDLIPADPIIQAKAMYQRIEQPVNQRNPLYRQHVILFGDAVDRYAALRLVELSRGQDRKTAAFEAIAEGLKTEKKKVAKRYTHSRLYLKLAEIGGPGSLCSIDGSKWDMENTNEEDIKLLCNYRKERLPAVEMQSQALDFMVVEDFARNLLVQGVDAAEIAVGRTTLAKLICRHVEIERFVQDGTITPKRTSVYNNEQPRRTSPRSPARTGSRMDVRTPSHTMSFDLQRPVPLYHALQSQQPAHAAATRTNTAKRRRVSGDEDLQILTESDSIEENEQTCFAPRSQAPQFTAGTRTYDQGDHQTEETPDTLQSLEKGNENYLKATAVELCQQSSSCISSSQDKQSLYTFRDLDYGPGSSSNTSNGVLNQSYPSENGDAMGEARCALSSGDVREEEDQDDSELPSVVVRNLRIGEERLGDLDLFTNYYY